MFLVDVVMMAVHCFQVCFKMRKCFTFPKCSNEILRQDQQSREIFSCFFFYRRGKYSLPPSWSDDSTLRIPEPNEPHRRNRQKTLFPPSDTLRERERQLWDCSSLQGVFSFSVTLRKSQVEFRAVCPFRVLLTRWSIRQFDFQHREIHLKMR